MMELFSYFISKSYFCIIYFIIIIKICTEDYILIDLNINRVVKNI